MSLPSFLSSKKTRKHIQATVYVSHPHPDSLAGGMKCTLSKLAGDTKLSDAVDNPKRMGCHQQESGQG